MSGFIGKVGLILGGIEADTPTSWTLVGLSTAVSLLTLYALAKVWNRAFWQDVPRAISNDPVSTPRVMTLSTAALVAFSLVLTIAAGPLIQYSEAAAGALLERRPYVGAVLGEQAAADIVFSLSDRGEEEVK